MASQFQQRWSIRCRITKMFEICFECNIKKSIASKWMCYKSLKWKFYLMWNIAKYCQIFILDLIITNRFTYNILKP